MATDHFDKGSTTVQSGVSLLQTAIGLAPMAAGAWYGYNRIQANESISVPLPGQNPHKALGEKIGGLARQKHASRNKRAQKTLERIRQQLSQGLENNPVLKEALSSVEQHNALLHSLSISIEDPALGLEEAARNQIKSQISDAMAQANPKDVKSLTERIVQAMVDSGSGEALLKLEQTTSEYANIGGMLETPSFGLKTGVPFNKISQESLLGEGRRNLARLREALGSDYDVSEIVERRYAPGEVYQGVQVRSRSGRWLDTVPLHLSGSRIMFRGEDLNTAYGAPRYAADMSAANRLFRRDPAKLGVQDLSRAGVLKSFESFYIGSIERAAAGGDIDFKQTKNQINEALIVANRAATGGALQGHVLTQLATQTNAMIGYNFTGMTADESTRLVGAISGSAGFDPGTAGAKKLLTGHGRNRRAVIGLTEGSLFQDLQGVYGNLLNRGTLPITARDSQITGRMSQITGPASGVRLSSTLSGSIAETMVIDFANAGSLTKQYGDLGQAIRGETFRTIKPETVSILDPRKVGHSYAASAALNQVMATGAHRFTREELGRAGAYIGETASGPKRIGADPRTRATTLRFTGRGSAYGKEMLYFVNEVERQQDLTKLFGFTFKGNVRSRGNKAIDLLYQRDKRLRQNILRQNMGVLRKSDMYRAIHTSSDMFSKGEFMFVHQLAGSAVYAAGLEGQQAVDLVKRLSARAQGITTGLGTSARARMGAAVFEHMVGAGRSGAQIGSALAGLWHGAEGKGTDAYGLDRGRLKALINRSRLSSSDKIAAIDAMKRGVVTMTDYLQQGEGAGDWGAARAGMEARIPKTMQERLMSFGMKQADASDIVANVYKNKIGFSNHFVLAKDMLDLGRSITGQAGLAAGIDERNATRVTWGELSSKFLGEGGAGDFLSYLKQQEGGLIIDFEDAPAHMRRAVKDSLGQESVRLPGASAFSASAGTQIKQAGGGSIDVAGAYGRFAQSLYGRLTSYSHPSAAKELRTALGVWQEEGLDLMANVVSTVTSGKLSGSSSPRAEIIKLSSANDLTNKQVKRLTGLSQRTGFTAATMDTVGFLSELHNQKGKFSFNEVSKSAREFFTAQHMGLEDAAKMGQVRMAGRHPVMSSGNIFALQVFRDVRDIGADDKLFKDIMETGFMVKDKLLKGDKLMEHFFAGDKNLAKAGMDGDWGFSRISKATRGNQIKFFNSLIANIESFTGGAGGGSMQMLEFEDKAGKMFGLSAAALADGDGDTLISMRLAGKDAKAVKSAIVDYNTKNLGSEARFRMAMGEFSSRIKEGIVGYSKTLGNVADPHLENIKKEVSIDQVTGKVDVAMRRVHDAVMQYGGGGQTQRLDRLMMGALAEQTILKAKKMEVYSPVAMNIATAMDELASNPTRTNADRLKEILSKQVLGGETKFTFGQIKIAGGSEFDDIRDRIMKATAGKKTVFDVNESVDRIFSYLQQAKSAGTNVGMSPGQIKAGMQNHPGATLLHMLNGQSLQTAAVRAAAGDSVSSQAAQLGFSWQQVKNSIASFDRRMTVPLALGAGASILAAGVIGGRSYAADPISMPGEQTSSEVLAAISKGNLFAPSGGAGPTAEQMQQGYDDYGMIDRPINVPTTYANRPNAYSIRGQLPTYAGVDQAVSLFNQMTGFSGSGSVRINDTRRPITSAYSDRLLGEY